MNKYMYDCYDKDRKPLGIFFEDGTRFPVWREVEENGLFPYKPKK